MSDKKIDKIDTKEVKKTPNKSDKKIIPIFIAFLIFVSVLTGLAVLNNSKPTVEEVKEIPALETKEEPKEEVKELELDTAGLLITNSLSSKLGLKMGFIWSDYLTSSNQALPIETANQFLKIPQDQKNSVEYKGYPFDQKRLRDLIQKPEVPEKTNWLSFSTYEIEAPILYASFQDFFEQDPSKPANIIDFTKPIQEDPREIAKGNYESVPVQRLLKDGIVHLPFSTYPGESGHSFIVGHSSNFSSVKSDYNKIFKAMERSSKVGDIFYIYDFEGRKMKFEVFEAIEILEADVDTAYRPFPNPSFRDKDRVVTLQGSILETVNGTLQPTKRWLTRGQLVLE